MRMESGNPTRARNIAENEVERAYHWLWLGESFLTEHTSKYPRDEVLPIGVRSALATRASCTRMAKGAPGCAWTTQLHG